MLCVKSLDFTAVVQNETWRGCWAVIYSLFLSLLHWLKGHCQGIFFIIFQIIFLTVYNNPLKAWHLNLSLPKVSIIHSHRFVVVDLRLYVGLVPFEFLSLKAHVKVRFFVGLGGWTKGETVMNQVGCSANRGKKQKVKFGPFNLDSVPLNISLPHTLDPSYWAWVLHIFQYELPHVTVTPAAKIKACLKQAIQSTLEEL